MKKFTIKKAIEKIIFNIRWMLIPFYLKLVYTLGLLLVSFYQNNEPSTNELVNTLEALDIVMIANLIKMIITGSYNSFVSKEHGFNNENISSGLLKVKMTTSLVGVSSINLLQTFINAANIDTVTIEKKVAIHATFLIGALTLMVIEYLHVKSESMEEKHNK